jgi:hypothetical protein
MKASLRLILVLAAALIAGCGPAAPSLPVARLAGKVTVNGRPLPADAEGAITFMSAARSQAPPIQVRLSGDSYTADAVPIGHVSVLFNITRLTGRMVHEKDAPRGTPFPEREILVPANCREGIPIEVTGDNLHQNFDLHD